MTTTIYLVHSLAGYVFFLFSSFIFADERRGYTQESSDVEYKLKIEF